jgi:8-oxo-dGTP diphosphatase
MPGAPESRFIQRNVKTTVGAIITKTVRNEIRILLTRRGYSPFQCQWCLPGGHIDPFETARKAVVREVKEEVGLDFKAQFFGYFDEIIPELDIHAVVLIFDGPTEGELKSQPGEVIEMGWFTLKESKCMDLAFHHNQIIEAYCEKAL